MDAKIVEQKLQAYFDVDEDVQGDKSHKRFGEFDSLEKELAVLLGVDPATGYEGVVRAAFKVIDEDAQQAELEKHREWLRGFDPQHLKNWERMLKDHPDGAKCEMLVRVLLESNGNTVEPNLDLSGNKPSPDFRCTQNGKTFFVEVTALDTDRVTKATALPPHATKDGKAYAFADLNQTIFAECIEKTRQCANLEHPALIAVGLFHFQASVLCVRDRFMRQLLTGKEYITYDLKGNKPAFISTKLEKSTFIKPDRKTGEIVPARNPVSGILVCGFGGTTSVIQGVLNSRPVHEFDHTLLPNIQFYRLEPGYESGSMKTEVV